MGELSDNSVDCIITSPPYWQLRDYGYPEQWGLEPTYQEYLEHLWQFMDEAKRVLKDTGTVWINLGDTYGANFRGGDVGNSSDKQKSNFGTTQFMGKSGKSNKCLLLIPHRFAIGCIERGWILRNDIIWAKRNGMPESVTDRFSKKHEYFFLFVKNQKYYFDLDGIREKHKTNVKFEGEITKQYTAQAGGEDSPNRWQSNEKYSNPGGKNPGSVSDFWDIPTLPSSDYNKRKKIPKKHYASFNFKLIEKPIMAGCPEGGTVLDPFCGVATTLVRAIQLNRKVIGIDASKEYCDIAEKNIFQEQRHLKLF